MSVVTVETRTRWETTSLLRKLRRHQAYAVQVGPTHWLVRSTPRRGGAGMAEIEALVSEWEREEGRLPNPAQNTGVTDADPRAKL